MKCAAGPALDAYVCSPELMKEPVLQDTRLQHMKFCKYANELIEKVVGKMQSSNVDTSLEKIRKVRRVGPGA